MNIEKINENIKETKNALLCASCLQRVMQNIESNVLSPLLNPRTLTPTPVFSLFLLFQKKKIIENKYGVLGFPGNKFSGRVRDENK